MRKAYAIDGGSFVSISIIHDMIMDYIDAFNIKPDRIIVPYRHFAVVVSHLGMTYGHILEQGKKFSPYVVGPCGLIEIVSDALEPTPIDVSSVVLENSEAAQVDKILLGENCESAVHRRPTSKNNEV